MSALLQDVRYALRTLRRSPGFAAVAIGTLALGIGADVAIFSVFNAVILKPLPFERPEELVRVTSDFTRQGRKDLGLSAPELFDYRRSGVFAEICGVWPIDANITGMDRPERADVLLTDADYFHLLGVRPEAGRFFAASDYQPGIAPVAVISDSWWRRHYGGQASAIGRQFRLDDDLYTIVGVAPPGFRHPGRTAQGDVDVWAASGWIASPFPAPTRRAYFLQGALARLAPGWTPATAQKRIDEIAARWRRDDPNAYPVAEGWAPRVLSLQQDLVGNVRPALTILLAAVGFVLLITCANVAGLLLVRASGRQREIAIRQALGAGRGRLIRQLLSESVLLAAAGGALGVAVAQQALDALVRLSPGRFPRLPEAGIDLRVLAFALALSVATGILFGIAPALHASGADLQEQLKEGARGDSGSARGGRLRSALVVGEVALSLVLLVAAGLLVRTLWRLQRVDPGFDSRGLATASVWLPQPNLIETGRYFQHGSRVTLFRRILERAQALPGVDAAVAATRAPFGGARATTSFRIDGRDPEHGGIASADLVSVSPGYFSAMKVPLLRGRLFADQDDERSHPVAIVSESLARRAFPGEDPIGKQVQLPGRNGPGPWTSIVGVVRDVKMDALDADQRPVLYRPLWQVSSMNVTFVLRGPRRAAELASRIENAVRGIDPELPVYAVRSMEEAMASTVSQRRFAMLLLGLFAGAALVLSAIGIYGIVSYTVARRTREIGIRMALGARPADALALVIGQGVRLILAGVALGLAGSLVLTRALATLLYGVSPRDPVTFAGIAALLVVVALAASYLPARRASVISPTEALRAE
jgi:predicted permease